MDLLWAKYRTKKNKHAYSLFVELGTQNDKLHLLKTDNLSPEEIAKLRHGMGKIQGVPLAGKVSWIRDNLPDGFKKAYRTLYRKNVTVMSTYKPKPL
jgi:hypothetical protein